MSFVSARRARQILALEEASTRVGEILRRSWRYDISPRYIPVVPFSVVTAAHPVVVKEEKPRIVRPPPGFEQQAPVFGPKLRWECEPSRAEKRLVKAAINEELEKGGPSCRERVAILEELLAVCESDWHGRYIRFRISDLRRRARIVARRRKAAALRHRENQRWWKEEGGQQAVYLKNHPFGGMDHSWFVAALSELQGMAVSDGCESWDEDESSPLKGGRLRKPRARREAEFYGPYHRPLPMRVGRDATLLWRLRQRVKELRARRSNVEFIPMCPPGVEWGAKCEADGPEGENTAPAISQHSNIVITEQHGASMASETSTGPAASLVCSDIVDSYTSLVNRELVYKTVGWDTTSKVGSVLLEADLPRDFVLSIRGTPNAVPFEFNRYMRGDMIVRVQVNTNPFMIGSLQVAWFYQAECDVNFSSRRNIASYSQTLHALVSAGTSNEAILRIPYKNFKPLVEIGQRADKSKSLYLGKLIIAVLNPLVASSTSDNAASVTTFISFDNTEFTGYIHRDINKPEMETAAVVAGMAIAERMIDGNRDKPTTSAKPTFFTPQLAQSWSHGTGMSEDTFDLRLERADVPHPIRYTDAPFTQRDICQRYGLVRTFDWNTTAASGAMLLSVPGTPVFDIGNYVEVVHRDVTAHVLPPVAFMSNLFQYWRGSLKLRLDFVATKFHTGRLLLTYVPGDYQSDLQLSQVKASTSVIFDLKESQQCNFIIPYMADKMMWPRRLQISSSGISSYAPGHVYIFVLNKLVAMDSIPNKVSINMYISGAEDFELFIPAQPTIGLCFNPNTIQPSGAKAYITNSTSDGHYIGTYTDLAINNVTENLYIGISRYGPIFGHISQVYMPEKYDYDKKFFYYLKCDGWKINVRSEMSKTAPDTTTEVAIPFYDGAFVYFLPCRSAILAEAWCKLMITNKGNYAAFATAKLCRDTFYAYPKGDDADPYQPEEEKWFALVKVSTEVQDDFDLCDDAKPEMDPRVDQEQPTLSGVGLVPTTGYGRSELGEAFGDLKDICRRYQVYGSVSVPKTSLATPGRVIFEFPVLPQGLDLDIGTATKPKYFWNHLRDGIIPLLLSGYRFFRGSIRFRIMLPDNSHTYFVQHIPYHYTSRRKVRLVKRYADGSDCFNHGYAYTLQARSINNVLSFEVPFYLNVDCMMLQQNAVSGSIKGMTDLHYAFSLGLVRVGVAHFETEPIHDGNFEIVYALGDDARPSVFQGFPAVITTGDIKPIPKMEAKPEMIKALTSLGKAADVMANFNANEVEEKTLEALGSVQATSSSIAKLADSFKDASVNVKDSFTNMIETLKNSHAPQILINALSHCVQVIYNPDPVVMGIALASFLLSLGIACFETLQTLVKCATNIFRALLPKHPEEGEAAPQSDLDRSDVMSLVSMLFAGICTALNVKATHNSKYSKGWANDLMYGLTEGAKGGSVFFRFLANIMNTLVKIYDYIVLRLFPDKLGLEHIVNEREMVTKWCEQCMMLLLPENESLFDICPSMVDQVHSAYILGSLIMAKLSSARGVNVSLIKDFYSKIVALRTNLYDRGYGGTIRREPFVVWVGGAPGIGKSHLAAQACMKMLRAAEVPFVGSPIYSHPAGAKYWENLNQEPVILMDDAFVTRTGELNESEIQTFMSIKSPCLFTPPMAECERKKKRYAPEIVYVNSNNNFPELSNMETKEAIYRRRDFMVVAKLKDEYSSIKEVPDDVLHNFDHLIFEKVLFPEDPEKFTTHKQTMSYTAFIRQLEYQFTEFRKRQIVAHQMKVDYMNESIAAILKDERYKTDPLSEYVKQYAEAHSFPDILSFVPMAEAVLNNQQARVEIAEPQAPKNSKDDSVMRKLQRGLDALRDFPQWTELERHIVTTAVVDDALVVVKCLKAGEIQNCLKRDPSVLPCELLLVFSLGFKFIDWLEKINCGDGIRMMYSMAREKNPELHVGCAAAVITFINKTFKTKKAEYLAAATNLDGVVRKEITTLIASMSKPSQPDLDKIEKAPEIKIEPPKRSARSADANTTRHHPIEANVTIRNLKAVKEIREIEEEAAGNFHDHKARSDFFDLPEPEKLTLIRKFKPTRICEGHLNYVYTKMNLEELGTVTRLLGIHPRTSKVSKISDLEAYLRLGFENKTICPHFLAMFYSFTSQASTCCFNSIGVRHFCIKSCSDSDCLGHLPAVLDERCRDFCVTSFRWYRTPLRNLYIKQNPGTINKIAENSDEVPKILHISTFEGITNSIRDGLSAIYNGIWSLLKKTAKFFASVACSVFNFIKKYKYIFITALAAVGIVYCARNTEYAQSNTLLHVVTTPSEICEGISTLFSGTSDNVRDLFKASRNWLTRDAETGDLGEQSAIHIGASPELIPSADPRTAQRAARANFKRSTIRNLAAVKPTSKKGPESQQSNDVLRRTLIKNTVMLVAYNNETDPSMLNRYNSDNIRGLFIGDRYLLTVNHSWETFTKKEYNYLGFFIRDRWVACKLDSVIHCPLDDKQLCILAFPASCPQFRNIVNFIASEADHCLRTPAMGSLIKIDEHLCETVVPISARLERLPVSGDRHITPSYADGCYTYPLQGNGVCGSILVSADRNAPIYGMHFSGNDSTRMGFSMPLMRETFEPLFDMKPRTEHTFDLDDILLDSDMAKIDIVTSIYPVGTVKKQYAHKSATKTAIVESPIHGYEPPTSEPAPLVAKDPRLPPGNSPLVRGVEKHGVLTDNFPASVVLRTRERLQDFILVSCKPHRKPKLPNLTDQQAVCGDPALPYCDPLTWDSSEGFPWYATRPPGVTNKKWMFNLEEEDSQLKLKDFHPILKRHLINNRLRRYQNETCPTIFTDCLKDARIPIYKVSQPGKTRIFSMSPVDYTIDFRKYFYDFISSFQLNRFQCMNMIGINVFSDEWNTLALSLLKHNNICTGDYSNFGPGLNEEVAYQCMEIILQWYDYNWPENDDECGNNTRRCLAAELINALHLCVDLVYRVGAGIPSGSPITVILNSLVNLFYIFAAWDILSQEWDPNLQPFQNFYDNVVLYTYGDDFIMSVSDTYKDLFNSKTIAACLGKFNIKLTDAFKGEEITPYTTLDQSSFLKNRFVHFDSRWWAALDKDSIHDMCNWIRESPDAQQALIDNCEAALLHAQGWGRHFYYELRNKLIRACRKEGILLAPRTWDQIVDLKLGSSFDSSYAAYLHKIIG